MAEDGAGLPWLDQASRVLTQVGFPVAAACVLLWYVLFRFGDTLAGITSRMERNADAVMTLLQSNDRNLEELKRQTVTLDRQTVALEEIVRQLRDLARRAAPPLPHGQAPP
jgi:hypothetical protein